MLMQILMERHSCEEPGEGFLGSFMKRFWKWLILNKSIVIV